MGKPKVPKKSDENKEAALEEYKNFGKQSRLDTLQRLKLETSRYGPVKFKQGEGENAILVENEDEQVQIRIFETTGIQNPDAGLKLIEQAFASQPYFDAKWNRTASLMHAVAPQDGVEGLLAAQMITAHNLALECSRRAMVKDQYPEAFDRYMNHSVKFMRVFTSQMEALQRYRSKGQQQILVKHQQVNVGDGGQAIVGDIHHGGGGHAAKK